MYDDDYGVIILPCPTLFRLTVCNKQFQLYRNAMGFR